jgi:hypothetical protein
LLVYTSKRSNVSKWHLAGRVYRKVAVQLAVDIGRNYGIEMLIIARIKRSRLRANYALEIQKHSIHFSGEIFGQGSGKDNRSEKKRIETNVSLCYFGLLRYKVSWVFPRKPLGTGAKNRIKTMQAGRTQSVPLKNTAGGQAGRTKNVPLKNTAGGQVTRTTQATTSR